LLLNLKEDADVNNKKGFDDVYMNNHLEKAQGILYIVATPIGNLEDITLRAIRVLKEVDLIAAEDTRHSRILFNAYDIQTPVISLHEHNEKGRSAMIISKLKSGANVAYVSDAGTPCISDPGYHLVDLARDKDIRVVPIPGASAVITSLSVCGFPVDHFLFCGFLPPKENQRRRYLESIQNEQKTIIFYESPARIAGVLNDVLAVFGDRQIVLARELTKMFEDIRRGPVSELIAQMSAVKARGEFTVIVQGAVSRPVMLSDEDIRCKLMRHLDTETASLRDAIYAVVRETELPKKRVYDIAVKMRPDHHGN
jgi:16S rRNA (cytidine1402-2'-O)-methyltransferase